MKIAIYCGISSWVNICDKLSGDKVDYFTVKDWVSSASEGDYLVFGTDIIPYSLFEYPEKPIEETTIFSFIRKGGRVIWIGDIPLYYREKIDSRTKSSTKEILGSPSINESLFPYYERFVFSVKIPSLLPIPVSLKDAPYSFETRNTIVGDNSAKQQL